MRFVPTKTPEQQSGLVLHRTRHLFIRQQTSVINAIRAHLAEFGIVAPVGRRGVEELLTVVADPSGFSCVASRYWQFDRLITAVAPSSSMAPGVGPVCNVLWSPPLLTQRSSDQGATSRLG